MNRGKEGGAKIGGGGERRREKRGDKGEGKRGEEECPIYLYTTNNLPLKKTAYLPRPVQLPCSL